jgi:tetratricopeptide (TPR) repeat protein
VVDLKRFIKIIISTLVLGVILGNNVTVKADTPYKTFTQDGYSNYVETQTAYTSLGAISKVGEYEFSKASDIKIGRDGHIYIADTGNKRVLVSTKDGELVRIIGEGVLDTPLGLFVTDDNYVYVADEYNERVYVFSGEGELIREYSKPTSPLFGATNTFRPQKITVDRRGNMYIISKGNSNGIIQMSTDEEGTFLGYFGANDTRVSLLTIFRKAIFTDEQKDKMIKSVPLSATNLAIDSKGLIYTVSQGERSQTLKKLNMGGRNIIHPTVYDRFPASVAVGPIDNIFVASRDGYIYEYTSEGSLLFVFGGRDDGRQRIGLFKSVSAIAIDEDKNLYVLDSEINKIEIYKTTEFADLVHEALTLYQNGQYEQSKGPWNEVLRMNSLFDFANLGMGEALFKEGNYEEALTAYRLAKYRPGYSDSFWEIRNEWMRQNLVKFILGLLIYLVISKIVKFLDRRFKFLSPVRKVFSGVKRVRIIRELTYLWYFIKHPGDGYYGIKRERKTSYLSATILYIVFFIIYVADKYASGFIFKTVQDGMFDIFTDFYSVFGAFALITICNYLVCTINDGEATFKDIYCGFIYSFMPYFLIKPFIIISSNYATFNERFLLDFANFIINAWVLILLIKMIKDINDYTIKETIKVILLTIFTVLIAVLVLFIVYVLISQVTDFSISIFREAVYRIGNR